MSEIKTVGDAFEVVIARLINQAGHEEIETFLSELKQAKVFDHPIYYTVPSCHRFTGFIQI